MKEMKEKTKRESGSSTEEINIIIDLDNYLDLFISIRFFRLNKIHKVILFSAY